MSDRFSHVLVFLAVAAVAFSWYITPWDPVEAPVAGTAGLEAPALEASAPNASETDPATPAPAKIKKVPTHEIDPRCPHSGSNKS